MKQYLATDQLVKCQQIQVDSYSIPFSDKDPHAMLGKNMTKWVHNAQLHIENNRLWEALDCERLFMLPNIRPCEKGAGWRSRKSIQRLVKLKALVHPALFSHTYNRTFREKIDPQHYSTVASTVSNNDATTSTRNKDFREENFTWSFFLVRQECNVAAAFCKVPCCVTAGHQFQAP